jgi:hypothetical protein
MAGGKDQGMMKRCLAAIAILCAVPAFAQSTPPLKVETGTALPPPAAGGDEAAVLAPIDALFAAFAKGDGAAVLEQVYPNGRVSAAGIRAGATTPSITQLSWTEFAATRVKPERPFQERIWDPAIEIDGDIAMVWAPFDVRLGGKVASCGYDLFDLLRENGRWKIMNISFSTRVTGCAGQ